MKYPIHLSLCVSKCAWLVCINYLVKLQLLHELTSEKICKENFLINDYTKVPVHLSLPVSKCAWLVCIKYLHQIGQNLNIPLELCRRESGNFP